MVSEHTFERSRLACLGLLGVDVYVSRRPLPQALHSRIITVAADPAPAAGASAPVTPAPDHAPPQRRPRRSAAAVLTGSAASAAEPSGVVKAAARATASAAAAIDVPPAPTAWSATPAQSSTVPPLSTLPQLGTAAQPSAEPPLADDAAATMRELSRAVAFNLVTVTFPSGVMFVSDIRQVRLAPVVESGVLSFLRDVMLAIGRLDPALALDVGAEYFQWPLVKKPGVDASERAARDVLAGLISRKLREVQADTIVLMGRAAYTFGRAQGSGQFAQPGVKVLHCEPLGKLFATPSRKAELWRILQPVIK